MKLITIQLGTKMNILTKYVVKPDFYNVILRMIFWNMKYLFYNCQLLLLCCVCCKFAIQAFVQEDRHAIQTALAKRLPQLPTAVYPSVFHRELQKITAFCHNYWRVYQQTCHNYRRIYRRVHWRMTHIPKRTPVRSYRWMRQNQCTRALAHNFKRICRRTSKNMERFSKFLVRESIKYRRKLPTDFNATAQKIIIIFSIGKIVI